MKNLILRAAALFFLSVPAFAQPETLFNADITSGGYGGPALKMTSLNYELGVMTGASAAWIINSSYSIGLGGYSLVDNVQARWPDSDTNRVAFSYGGLILGYQFKPDKLVHLGVQGLIGAGNVGYRLPWDDDFDLEDDLDRGQTVFVLEPGVTAELNVSSLIRLHLEGSYRFVSGSVLAGATDETLGGVAGTLTLKFGSF